MLNTLAEVATYALGWVVIGASLFLGLFLAVAGFYWINEKVSK